MKYIVTKTPEGTEEIFIFPKAVHHNDMAEAVQRLKKHDPLLYAKWERITREPISAGFVEGGKCVGNSESLMLASRPEDTDLLPWMNVRALAPLLARANVETGVKVKVRRDHRRQGG